MTSILDTDFKSDSMFGDLYNNNNSSSSAEVSHSDAAASNDGSSVVSIFDNLDLLVSGASSTPDSPLGETILPPLDATDVNLFANATLAASNVGTGANGSFFVDATKDSSELARVKQFAAHVAPPPLKPQPLSAPPQIVTLDTLNNQPVAAQQQSTMSCDDDEEASKPIIVKRRAGRPRRTSQPATSPVSPRTRSTRVKRTRGSSKPATPQLAPPLQASLDASGYRPKPSKRQRIGADDNGTPIDHIDRTEATAIAIAALPIVTETTSAAVPRETLLLMTSDALDEWQRRLSACRSLTGDDRRELQRQRRLVKNRESAQVSRLRKKGYIGELEAQLTNLSEQNAELLEKNRQLAAENAALTRDIDAIERAVAGDTRLAALWNARHNDEEAADNNNNNNNNNNNSSINNNGSSSSGSGGRTASATSSASSSSSTSSPRSMRAAVATLMLVLFSFGALFNSGGLHRDSLAPAGSGGSGAGSASGDVVAPTGRATGRALLAAPSKVHEAVAAAANHIASNNDTPLVWPHTTAGAHHDIGALRRLAEQFDRARPSLAPLLDLVPPNDAKPAAAAAAAATTTTTTSTSTTNTHNNNAAAAPIDAHHNTLHVHTSHEDDTPPRLVIAADNSNSAHDSSAASLVAWSERRASSGPVENATYWFTPQVRALRRGNDPNLLGLMLPMTAFDAQHRADSPLDADNVPVLELICEVKSVMRTPFFASSFVEQ